LENACSERLERDRRIFEMLVHGFEKLRLRGVSGNCSCWLRMIVVLWEVKARWVPVSTHWVQAWGALALFETLAAISCNQALETTGTSSTVNTAR
jgi:hypothetical protein